MSAGSPTIADREVEVPSGPVNLAGTLSVPVEVRATVVFAHGSGSGRFSPRNRAVARVLFQAGFATLMMDLLTAREEEQEVRDQRRRRFDIGLLADRVIAAIDWLAHDAAIDDLPPILREVPVGCFGASTGAAAALIAAAQRPLRVGAVVSRGGRPDLAGDALRGVTAPTLLIVGGNDSQVIELNRRAQALLAGESRLAIVPGAGHLFEEPGALERVAAEARDWFLVTAPDRDPQRQARPSVERRRRLSSSDMRRSSPPTTPGSSAGADQPRSAPDLVSEQIAGWLRADGEKTLGSLIDLFEEKSFAILFVLLLGVPALPLPTGGATHVFEIIAVLIALQLVAGRNQIWLPQRWCKLQLAGDKQQRFITGLMKLIRRLERFSRPRLRFLFDHRLSNIVFGLLVIGGSVGAFLAPPFTGLDTLPALGVVLLSLGVLLEDFLVVVAGLAVGAAGVVLEVVLGKAAINLLF
jgi:pimeloyl-ACP methyl ester carboxylesterase